MFWGLVFSALIIMVMSVIKPLFMVVTPQNLNKSVRECHGWGEMDTHDKEWRLGKSRYKVTNVYFHIHMDKLKAANYSQAIFT